MKRVVASLAAVLFALAGAGCGDDGAEPGVPRRATLVLDFTPNAAHAGIYSALRRGLYRHAGVDLAVRQPSASTDGPKLLAAGRAEFAILDIHDLGIARRRGLDLVGFAAIVPRPLASLIARADGPVRRPRDLEGRQVGVTGLPSDDAVVDSAVAADGGEPALVDRVTIGFNAVADLAADRVDAATGFWNAEAVALRRRGVAVRVFKVDRFGAPRYPELVLVARRRLIERDPELVRAVSRATAAGYAEVLRAPGAALTALLESSPALELAEQRAQLRALLPALRAGTGLDPRVLRRWARWDLDHGILDRPIDPSSAFEFQF